MASHTDSVCTASQCWNCVDTVEKSRTITKRPPWITTTATTGFLSWLLSIFRLQYWWYCVVKSRTITTRPRWTTTSATYRLLSWLLRYFGLIFLWLSVPLLVVLPQQHRHHLPSCLPPPSPPSPPTPAPATCHHPLSLFSVFPSSLQDPCLYHYHDHHHHDKTYHHHDHHCHWQPVATFTNFLFLMNSNRQDVFVCVKATCNKNQDLDFAPRITSEHVLVPLFHNHIWLSFSLCQPDAKLLSILSFSF